MNARASRIAVVAVLFCTGLAHYLGTAGPAQSAAADEPGENRTVAADVEDAQAIAAGLPGYHNSVSPFFKTYCVKCHGPEKSKGGITVHSLNGDLAAGQELDKWESVLDMLQTGEMPPIDEPQPTSAETQAVQHWIESGMRDYVLKASAVKPEAKTRRLTNFEYENTLSDLLGFELAVIDDLPEDPEHYYHFNNTAELMRIGPEQLDRYLEIARKAMRSAIVDPEQPYVIKARSEWKPSGILHGKCEDEISASMSKFGHIDTRVIGVAGPPVTGEFRVRLSASALLLSGHDEVPLQLIMGMPIDGDHNEKAYRVVGTAYLTNSPDDPKVFEFRGRIENIPFSTIAVPRKPSPVAHDGTPVQRRELRAQIIFDDGTLNDGAYSPQGRRLSMLRAVINWMEFETPVFDAWPPKHHTDILFESPLKKQNEEAYVMAVLERFMTRAYRRPAGGAEVERFVKVYRLVRPSVKTFEEAIRETLAMVLVSPRFLYHTESDPATDDHYVMASRLSYFLWASMPDQELFDLAAEKKLSDPQVIEQQVLRMLGEEKSHRFVENFTMQWLSIKKSLTVPINQDLFPRFLLVQPVGETAGIEKGYRPSVRDYMMQETIGFVEHLIRENKGVLHIVDSDFTILNERLAVHYGVEGVQGMQMRPVPIRPQHNLGGLLTHGSVLIGNGTGTAPHPIYRAVWLREAILGDTVAPPPSEVPALSDSAGASLEKALSIAQLLAKHRTVESCNDCHFRLDPWGIPFEEYNAVGQFQAKVPQDGARINRYETRQHNDLQGYRQYLDSINTVEVFTKARVPHGPEITGIRELKSYLLKDRQDDIVENVIRRLLSYGMGRHLTYRDRFAVEKIVHENRKSDFGMRDLIVSICLSDLFRESASDQKD
jgi:mono/diheme cytochrome c family protein